MNTSKYRILIISSFSPDRSAGLVQDYIDVFEERGNEVDFLTLYSFPGQKKNQYNVCSVPLLTRIRERFPVLYRLKRFKDIFFPPPQRKNYLLNNGGRIITSMYEDNPPIPVDLVVKAINKEYDFICVFFQQRMMSTATLKSIYDKFRVPILINCVDYVPMTGGCWMFGDCLGFVERQCGKCPILSSNDETDQTRKNFLYKKSVYSEINYLLICNTYMQQYAIKTGMFENDRVRVCSCMIDSDKFSLLDKQKCRSYFKIPSNKTFIILTRYAGHIYDKTKGYDNLLRSLNSFASKLSKEELKHCLIVTIGEKDKDYIDRINMDVIELGTVCVEDLVKIYNAASVFVSSSISDAGPSMVNQSMMCGTPVVAYSIGTALDVVKEGKSGYMAKNFDDDDFADGIYSIYKLNMDDYENMRKNTRGIAMTLNSPNSIAAKYEEWYESIKKC